MDQRLVRQRRGRQDTSYYIDDPQDGSDGQQLILLGGKRVRPRPRRHLHSSSCRLLSLIIVILSMISIISWVYLLFNFDQSAISDKKEEESSSSRARNHPRGRGFSSSKRKTDLSFSVYMESDNGTLSHHTFSHTKIMDCHKPYLTLPIDINDDPFLPWLHDYFVTNDATRVKFIAQNKRRCHTGQGQGKVMQYWEPQMALFQPVAVRVETSEEQHQQQQEASEEKLWLTDPENATYPETRFICRFHGENGERIGTTFSEYAFNYEYINWRKRGDKPMFVKNGPDVEIFDYSTLLFSCPIPESLRQQYSNNNTKSTTEQQEQQRFWLDLIPIRTPARYDEGYMLTRDQVGDEEFLNLTRFDTAQQYGAKERQIPSIARSGRYENLPACFPSRIDFSSLGKGASSLPLSSTLAPKRHQLIACTWAAANYDRRGGRRSIHDAPARLREWIAFHQMVGFDHIYIYDNTQVDDEIDDTAELPLKKQADLFESVTYIRWNATVCNNNFIGGRWPGERSSQYAAEASCRERFGPTTQWMAFFDIDEYLVPMGSNGTWKPLLDAKKVNSPVLGMRSSRALPRVELMEESTDTSECSHPSENQQRLNETCLVKSKTETFLRTYNCNNVRPPRPLRFFTEMKQIYQPEFVLSHFVHYSVVTRDHARYYSNWTDPSEFTRKPANKEKYVNKGGECSPFRVSTLSADSLFSFFVFLEACHFSTNCVKVRYCMREPFLRSKLPRGTVPVD